MAGKELVYFEQTDFRILVTKSKSILCATFPAGSIHRSMAITAIVFMVGVSMIETVELLPPFSQGFRPDPFSCSVNFSQCELQVLGFYRRLAMKSVDHAIDRTHESQ